MSHPLSVLGFCTQDDEHYSVDQARLRDPPSSFVHIFYRLLRAHFDTIKIGIKTLHNVQSFYPLSLMPAFIYCKDKKKYNYFTLTRSMLDNIYKLEFLCLGSNLHRLNVRPKLYNLICFDTEFVNH
jgi:hypothetical protein